MPWQTRASVDHRGHVMLRKNDSKKLTKSCDGLQLVCAIRCEDP